MRILHKEDNSFTLAVDEPNEIPKLVKLIETFERKMFMFEGYGGPRAVRVLYAVNDDRNQFEIAKARPDLAYSHLGVFVKFIEGLHKHGQQNYPSPFSDEQMNELRERYPVPARRPAIVNEVEQVAQGDDNEVAEEEVQAAPHLG